MTAPFPYFGGKRRWAGFVWARFGDPEVYCEPFFGSGAVLLGRPGGAPRRREVVCDRDGFVANFWRAMQWDPDGVAREADWPTNQQDLSARHHWLLAWAGEHAARVERDAEFYDVRAAGWWAWGLSNWIGSGWSQPAGAVSLKGGSVFGGGVGVSAQRRRPAIRDSIGACGVQGARRLVPWFREIQERMRRVIVLNSDWRNAVTPTVLCQTPSRKLADAAVFLDPPYRTRRRKPGLYAHDAGDEVAAACWAWALDHDHLKIGYACLAGDVEVPPGWTFETLKLAGYQGRRGRAADAAREQVLFSPACQSQPELGL